MTSGNKTNMYPTTNITYGQSGSEVTKLQNFLIGQGMNIPSGPTGYFGNETKAALLQWQQRVGVQAPTADLGSNWGPKSIEKAQSVNSSVRPVNSSVAPAPTPAPRTLTSIPGLAGGEPLNNGVVNNTRTLDGIPGLAGGTPLNNGQIQQPATQSQPYQSPYQAPAQSTSFAQSQEAEQDTINEANPVPTDTTSAMYDMLISKDPLLTDYFKDGATRAEFNNLPDDLKTIYLQMARSASQAIENGKVINPDLVQVTPAQLSEFYTQAETELDPYYKEQFGLLKGDLERSVGRLTEDYATQVSRSEEPFKQSLATQAQTESEQGTVYSSERNRRETSTILGQNQALGDLAQGVQRSATDLGIGFEQTAGSDLARSLNVPSIQNFNATSQGYTPNGTRSLYVPLGGVTGSGQAERTTALKTRQNELEADYRKKRVLDTSPLTY